MLNVYKKRDIAAKREIDGKINLYSCCSNCGFQRFESNDEEELSYFFQRFESNDEEELSYLLKGLI